jgi:hypothetical protein
MISLLTILLSVLPVNEAKMLARVSEQYSLSQEQSILLAGIRKTENGGPGLEFGVGQDQPGHRARRYPKAPARSFYIQACWAAGTIKKHYTGDLAAFAQRYCPKNSISWAANVSYWMEKAKEKTE